MTKCLQNTWLTKNGNWEWNFLCYAKNIQEKMRISSSCQKIQFHHTGANKWASSLGILVMFQALQCYATEAWQNFSRTKQEPWQRRMFVLLTQRNPPPSQQRAREGGREVRAPYRGCWNLIKHPSKQPQGGKKDQLCLRVLVHRR